MSAQFEREEDVSYNVFYNIFRQFVKIYLNSASTFFNFFQL